MNRPRFLIFLNPEAGSKRAYIFYHGILERILPKKNIDYYTVVTFKKGDIRNYIKNFKTQISDNYTTIAAMGGDGTTWETISSCVEFGLNDIPISIFPFGSGNDLARSLNIPPYNANLALKICLERRTDHLDVCSVNEMNFANYLSFGFEGEVVNLRALEGTALPGYTSYIKPVIKAVENLKYNLYHIKYDDKELDIIGLTCIISNIPSHYGGLKLVPEANYNDGLFEVTVLKKVPSLRTIMKLPFIHGKALDKPEIFRCQTNELFVRFDDEGPNMQIDGEAFKPISNVFKISIKNRALKIIKGA